LEEFFADHCVNIIVLDDEKQDKNIYDELLQDFMSLVASFSGKFYRLRSLKHEKMLLDLAQEELNKNDNA
jgi:putative resolvase